MTARPLDLNQPGVPQSGEQLVSRLPGHEYATSQVRVRQPGTLGEQLQRRVLGNAQIAMAKFGVHGRAEGGARPLELIPDGGRQVHLTHVKILTYIDVVKTLTSDEETAMTTATVTGPSFLALQVRDIEAAAGFYETQLGLTRAAQSPPGAVVFATSPVAFAVRNPLPGTDLESGQPGLGVALWMATGDAQGLHDRLAANGVPILAPPFQGPFGLTFVFRDPDGYAVTIHNAA